MNDELKKELFALRAHFTRKPDGAVILSKANKKDMKFVANVIPSNSKFEHKGEVNFINVVTLPDKVTFINNGDVKLDSLKTITKGSVFANNGDVSLLMINYEDLPKGFKFKNKGVVKFFGGPQILGTGAGGDGHTVDVNFGR